MPLTGDLKNDSPALYGSAARRFTDEQVRLLAAEYRQIAAAGGNQELDFIREEEASFNPRIARIASLVAHEGGYEELDALRAAVWSCLPGRLEGGILEVPREFVADRDECYRQTLAKTITAAASLDRLRHIHLSTAPLDVQRTQVLRVNEVLESGSLAGIATGLETKLRHVVAMQLRRVAVQKEFEE